MTGTANTEAGEFAHTYGLEVVQHPDQPRHGPPRRARPHLQDRGGQVRGARRRHPGALRPRPARAGRHDLGREVRAAREAARQAGHPALGAEREEARAGGGRRHPGRAASNAVTVATNMAGRGVDILLGGNPEGLAREEMLAGGATPEEDPEKYEALVEQFKAQCTEEGDQIRELGGLYVLGTERHESRRIDNQLRGRAGRQGDPGESRFYLSLEDELMRLFATGAMNWVMGKAFPDDLPLEAKMVTKAIERAQRTVEDRNFEIRKDVLKYDEVMNEQRKVIYKRRQQIIDGGDLREESIDAIEGAIDHVVTAATGGEEILRGLGRRRAHASRGRRVPDPRARATSSPSSPSPEAVFELLQRRRARAVRGEGRRDRRGAAARDRAARDALGDRPALARAPLRDGLPARGHQPPRDGPAGSARRVAARGLRHVRGDDGGDQGRLRPLHLPPRGRRRRRAAPPGAEPALLGAEDPVQGSGGFSAAAASAPIEELGGQAPPGDRRGGPSASSRCGSRRRPGRNEPCYCGSGKKYKQCHGR